MTTTVRDDMALFAAKLAEYKQLVDADIASYSKHLQKTTLQEYGAYSRVAVDAYLDILGRGGKRIRGGLVMLGYRMAGGSDEQAILTAARAVEMLHAYILIIDDINDRSATRRGGPAAHTKIAQYHTKHNLSDGAEHFGESIAMNAALVGNHLAQSLLAGLAFEPPVRVRAMQALNDDMVVTAHGQFNDMFNEVVLEVTERDVRNVMRWKTAHYTFLAPLAFGMILGGAPQEDIAKIEDYAINAGLAFQISDDILGTFGEAFESGKSPLDDIREGKRTLLTLYALEHAQVADKNFLIQMLGKHDLNQTEFERCKDILVESGALKYAQSQLDQYITVSLKSLAEEQTTWSPEAVAFLRGLAHYLAKRRS